MLKTKYLLDIQSMFVKKQQVLSQFNENTLVKGVSPYFISNA